MVGRKSLVVLLVPVLAFPAGATSEVVGTVLHSQATHIGGVPPAPGTTIFSGDVFVVAQGGTAQIALRGGGVLQLGAESQVRLSTMGGRVRLEIARGQLRFGGKSTTAVEAHVADATALAVGDAPVVGVVEVLGRSKATISAEKGSLEVRTAHDGKSVRLNEGQGVTLNLEEAPPQSTRASGLNTVGPRPLIIVATIGIVAMSCALEWCHGHEDKVLTERQGRDAVSPFRLP